MKKSYVNLSLLFSCFVCMQASFAQLSVTGRVESLKFLGDVGKKSNANYFSDNRLGYNIGIEYRLGRMFGVGIDGMYGKLAGTNNDISSHLNFQSTISGGAVNAFAFFDKLQSEEKEVAPYIHAGFGYLKFDPYGDLTDKNGTFYKYWNDGSIKNLDQSSSNEPLATAIKRDYTYESQLKDTLVNYARHTFYIPLGAGVKFNMNERVSLRLGVTYNLCMSDYVDNYKSGGNDSWASANAGISISFGKKMSPSYSGVNFVMLDNLDSDFDGIKDLNDKCLGTPKGVKVDAKGCPFDTDGDGIYDYLDKELKTKKGAIVDGFGVTINEEELAKRQLAWDSLSVEAAEENNLANNTSNLNQQQVNSLSNDSGLYEKDTMPYDFIEVDSDNDGVISVQEVRNTINDFFDEKNTLTADKINQLIDYFFEQ